MQARPNEHDNDRWLFLPPSRGWTVVVFVVVLLVAFGVRAYKIWNPPLDYPATRPYRSALIARALYLRSDPSTPEMERRVAEANLASEPALELPLMEYMAVSEYRVLGRVSLGAARLLSTGFWLVGTLFVFGIAKRMGSRDAALLAVLFYLFAPFGIASSRAFQRDPLMIMLMLGAIHGLVRYFEQPSLGRLVLSAIAAAASLFVKPLGAFVIAGTYVALTLWTHRSLRPLFRSHAVLFGALALLPAVAFAAYQILVQASMRAQAARSFVPSLLLTGGFWKGWFGHATRELGWVPLVGSFLCLAASRNTRYRVLAAALWTGYFVFGLVFNMGIHSHCYYQLMLVPIVALSLAPLGDRMLDWMRELPRRPVARTAAWSLCIIATATSMSGYICRLDHVPFGHPVAVREEIGAKVGHSTCTIMLDIEHGTVLKYHGWIDGDWWPSTTDLKMNRQLGRSAMSAEARLDKKLRERPADFFIVADMNQYHAQPALGELLTSRYPVLAESGDYIIFDLRHRIDERLAPAP